jgi:hypothetical protein
MNVAFSDTNLILRVRRVLGYWHVPMDMGIHWLVELEDAIPKNNCL